MKVKVKLIDPSGSLQIKGTKSFISGKDSFEVEKTEQIEKALSGRILKVVKEKEEIKVLKSRKK